MDSGESRSWFNFRVGGILLKAITNVAVRIVNRWMPDAFLFAIILTIITFIGCVVLTGVSPLRVLTYWGSDTGFWGLLAFTMQMCLVVVLGSALAHAPVVNRLLVKCASLAHTPKQGIVVTVIVSGICMWINWGFGLIAGVLLAKEVAKRIPNIDYRVLIASGYSVICMWHAGLSGSIPLTITQPGILASMGYTDDVNYAVSTAETIFFPVNLAMVAVVIIACAVVMVVSHPDAEHTVAVDPALLKDDEVRTYEKKVPADAIEQSKILWAITWIAGFAYIIYYFVNMVVTGADVLSGLTLNIVNMIFMFLGILAHGSLRRYIDAIGDAATSAAGIILQFPFYAGIMGIMVGTNDEGVCLASIIATTFVSIATPITFPMFTFLAGGLINIFVPSGGGQWAVQGPISMPAAAMIGCPAARAAMGIAWGDCWTNLIQPFWALPALAIAGLSARDIMGYLVMLTIVVGVIVCIGFVIWAMV